MNIYNSRLLSQNHSNALIENLAAACAVVLATQYTMVGESL